MNNANQSIATVLTTKKSKSLFFLIITILSVVALNAGLPLIQGQAKYTVNEVEMNYSEYLILKSEDQFVDMSYASKLNIVLYKEMYKTAHPELTPEEIFEITIPSTFKVNVYTGFFFVSAGWWIATGIGVLSAVLIFYSIRAYYITSRMEKDEQYVTKEKEVNDNNRNYIDPNTFEPYIDNVFNRDRKVRQHISNVKYEITALNEKTSVATKKEFEPYFKPKQVDPNNPLLPTTVRKPVIKWYQSRKRKYLNKMERLLALLDEEYIKEYIIDSKVKYFKKIQPGFVYSGINRNGRTTDEYSTILSDSEHTRQNAFKKVFSAIGTSVGFAAMFTVAGFTSGEGEWYWYLLNVVTKIAPLVLQWVFALQDVNAFFSEQLMPNLQFRLNIQGFYLGYMKKEQANGK